MKCSSAFFAAIVFLGMACNAADVGMSPPPAPPPPPPLPPLVRSVEIVGVAGAVILVGGTLQATALGRDFEDNVVALPPRWEVRPESVAAVTPAGLITGISPGSAIVLAYIGSATGVASFSVIAAAGTLQLAPPATPAPPSTESITTSSYIGQLGGAVRKKVLGAAVTRVSNR